MRTNIKSKTLSLAFAVLLVASAFLVLAPKAQADIPGIVGSQPPPEGDWEITQHTIVTDVTDLIINGSIIVKANSVDFNVTRSDITCDDIDFGSTSGYPSSMDFFCIESTFRMTGGDVDQIGQSALNRFYIRDSQFVNSSSSAFSMHVGGTVFDVDGLYVEHGNVLNLGPLNALTGKLHNFYSYAQAGYFDPCNIDDGYNWTINDYESTPACGLFLIFNNIWAQNITIIGARGDTEHPAVAIQMSAQNCSLTDVYVEGTSEFRPHMAVYFNTYNAQTPHNNTITNFYVNGTNGGVGNMAFRSYESGNNTIRNAYVLEAFDVTDGDTAPTDGSFINVYDSTFINCIDHIVSGDNMGYVMLNQTGAAWNFVNCTTVGDDNFHLPHDDRDSTDIYRTYGYNSEIRATNMTHVDIPPQFSYMTHRSNLISQFWNWTDGSYVNVRTEILENELFEEVPINLNVLLTSGSYDGEGLISYSLLMNQTQTPTVTTQVYCPLGEPVSTLNVDSYVYDAETGVCDVVTSGNVTAYLSFNGYMINATAASGGSISPAGIVNAATGSDKAFSFTPLGGYAVKQIYIDDAPVGIQTSYTFEDISGPHSIRAEFDVTYTLTVTSPNNGTVSPAAGAHTYLSGSSVNLTASSDLLRTFVSFTINGATFSASSVALTMNQSYIVVANFSGTSDPGVYTVPVAVGTVLAVGTAVVLAYRWRASSKSRSISI